MADIGKRAEALTEKMLSAFADETDGLSIKERVRRGYTMISHSDDVQFERFFESLITLAEEHFADYCREDVVELLIRFRLRYSDSNGEHTQRLTQAEKDSVLKAIFNG